MSEEKITGPFGFWTFPILNLIHEFIQLHSLLLKQLQLQAQQNHTPVAFPEQFQQVPRAIVNKEEWEVKRDANGRLQGFVVHRKLTEEENKEEKK